MGVDVEGNKHVLAIREGATENAAVAKELLEDLAAPPRRSRSRSLRPSESSESIRRQVDGEGMRRDRGVPAGVVIARMRSHRLPA